jgi:hypothetical protein
VSDATEMREAIAKINAPDPDDAPPEVDQTVSLKNHPRARDGIRRAKGWGGLIGFALVALVAWKGGSDVFDAGLRALAGGVVGYAIAWALALSVWRQVALGEIDEVQARFEDAQGMPLDNTEILDRTAAFSAR